MKKLPIFILLFLMATAVLLGQVKDSKADGYFYGYAYADAISEYQKEMQKGVLTNAQRLNLADSYFRMGNYKEASKIYLDVTKNDTIITSNRFNTMLQSLSKIGRNDSIQSLLVNNDRFLSNELMDNAKFNYELLQSANENISSFEVFNINGNSEHTDFSPAFFEDKLLFSSGRGHKAKQIYGPSGEAYLDIYVAKIGADGDIVNPNLFEHIPPSKYHKSTPFYSDALKKVFYVLSNEEDGELLFDDKGKNSLAIGLAKSSSGPDRSFNYLLKDLSTSFYYPFYQEETGKLYFAANFKDSYGGTDIYFVYTNNAQIMSEPINAGPRVNSAGNEIAPFILDNSLYFSSDVFYGLGGMDIYKTNIQADDTYSTPVNLGNSINSAYDDFGLIVRHQASDSFLGYFSSNRPGGKGKDDIYGFKVNKIPGLKTLLFRGVVSKPKTKSPIAEVSVKLIDKGGNVLKEVMTDAQGNYRLEIPWRDEVVLTAVKAKHSNFYRSYDKEALETLTGTPQQIDMMLLADIVEVKENLNVIKVGEFFFEKGKSEITPAIEHELAKVTSAVEKFPEIRLRIETHTDSRGYQNSNLKLSQQQADAIKKYLISKGAKATNFVSAKGYGETRLTNNCKDGVYCLDFLHNQNARTLFVVDNFDDLN